MSSLSDHSETTPILYSADNRGHENPEDMDRAGGTRLVHPWIQQSEETALLTNQNVGTSRGLIVIFIAIINVIANVLMNVTLPVFAGTMVYVGGDAFVVLLVAAIFFPVIFFLMIFAIRCTVNPNMRYIPDVSWKILFINGVLNTLNGVLVVFSSQPDRTPPYLQGILATTTIPYTVLFTPLILRKGISFGRLLCTAAVLVGLFITIEPQIWGLEGSSDPSIATSSGIGAVIWPLIFALGFLPLGISNVVYEKALENRESKSLTVVTWTQVFQLLTIFPVFWVDFIPNFGKAGSVANFGERLKTGLHCCFSLADNCNGLIGKLWLFVAGYCFGNLFQCLLIAYGEGAVFAVVVQSMVAPIVALFWTLFQFDVPTNDFFWNPRFTITTAFTIAGLVIIVPAIILYNYLSRDEQDTMDTENTTTEETANNT